jgi:hypothetical protein
MWYFVIGFIIGAFVGAFVAGSLKSASEEDKRNGWK